ncbi:MULTISPECIES: pitrilysin family protein [unclassified Massilia]|uniref:M16 family metallopeptidase n=1 Tax=unclassified Massilia TaxID=2609279 RepID=UPI0017847D98|nr:MULTISPECIES: pitrilysin family protein [unclassified Massilia]MBD8531979.1 insulinase family protein [Massilia sp. CFBP 13647]MBD8675407.1 insulinase family protein [Massilia sp. CFBP 13721]
MNSTSYQRGLPAHLIAGAFAACTFLAAGTVLGAPKATLPKGVTLGASVEGITEYRLANGLKVLLFPDNSRPTVTVNVTYLVGSRHENYGETGMAHLLEHLLFKGAKRNPDITRQFADRGMDFNGTTSLDRTNYYEVFQASPANLDWALQMEADRMTGSFIAQKDLDSEMTVVRNEFESGENSPSGVLVKRMQSIAYDWHSYGRSTIGNRSDIENVRIANLQAFYRTWYQPDNAVLLVAGKFEPNATLAKIARQFGAIPKPARTLPAFWTVEPTQDGERSFAVRRQGDVQIVMLGYKVPSSLHDDSDVMAFASAILGDVPTGRLHKQLVETGKASQVFTFGETGYAPGLQYIGAVVKKGEPLEPVRAALTEAVETFGDKPPTNDEMARIRRMYENEMERSLNDPQRVGVALSETIALGDWRLFFTGRERIKTITPDEVAGVAKRYFRRDNRVTGTFLPDDAPQRAVIPPAPSVESILKEFKPQASTLVAEDFEPTQDNIMKRTQLVTKGGVKLALLPKKNRGEAVTVNLRQHIGDEQNLFGKGAVPGLTGAMLMRGTSRYTREQLADEFDRLKIAGGLTHFQTTREHLPEALRLVAHVLKEPAFPAAEFEQLRRQALVSLEASRAEPQALAARALARHFDLYPKGDVRHANSFDEDLAELNAARLEDLRAFHREFYGSVPAEMAIVGDFDAAAIAPLVDELFGAWRAPANVAPVLRRHADIAPLKTTLDTPDKENGFYTARLNLDLNIDDPDYPALMLANYIFGEGGLRSRLMDRIRQKDGLSYGGGSQLDAGDLDRAGTFGISAIAAPQNLGRLDAAIRAELARAVKDGFTALELAGAKSGLMQQRQQTRAEDGAVAAGWTAYLYRDRTYDWSRQFEAKLMAVTLAQLNAAFRKAIDPAQLSVVMAGDQSKVKSAP